MARFGPGLEEGDRQLVDLWLGAALVADGFDFHIDRKFLYFAMAFSAGVETLNILSQRKHRRPS